MKKYKRIFTIVIDSLGAGAMPDAAEYGDAGTDTLGHISQSVEDFNIPNLKKLGIANLHPLKQVKPAEKPLGYYTYLYEASTGKDTGKTVRGRLRESQNQRNSASRRGIRSQRREHRKLQQPGRRLDRYSDEGGTQVF